MGAAYVVVARHRPLVYRAHGPLGAAALTAGLLAWRGIAPPWLAVGVAVAAASAALLRPAGSGRWLDPWVVPLWWVSLAGAYLCVPDTDAVVAALGLWAPVALAAWAFREHFGRSGAVWLAATLAGVAWWGAQGRPAALWGVVGALGVLVVGPVARRLWGADPRPGARLAVHGLAAVASARLAGLGDDHLSGALGAAAVLAALAVALPAVDRVVERRA